VRLELLSIFDWSYEEDARVKAPGYAIVSGTEHIFMGAGDGPCVILMAGARSESWQVLSPVSEFAASYGASAGEETSDPRQAYVRFEPSRRERPSYWERLPWV
jgi:hypothetical protein